MKNIFGAKAQTALIVKGISVLVLVFLVTFGVTSCKNETAPAVPQPTKYQSVLDTKVSPTPAAVETKKQFQELGTNTEIDYKSLCIGGGTAGQERRTLTIGGGQAVPRSATEIGGNGGQVSRRFAIGGHGIRHRKVTDIGGNQTARRFVDIGGNGSGSAMPRRLLNSKSLVVSLT